MTRLSLFVLVALLPSCANLKNPLSDPDEAKLDKRLLGVWEVYQIERKKPDKGEYGFAFVGKAPQPDAPPGVMKAIIIENDAEHQVKAKDLYFFTTSVNGRSFLNLIVADVFNRDKFPAWSKANISDYLLAKYTIKSDNLEIRLMDAKPLAAAVQKGQLKGTVAKKGFLKVDQVTITASSEELRQFILADKEDKLFPEEGRILFKKVK